MTVTGWVLRGLLRGGHVGTSCYLMWECGSVGRAKSGSAPWAPDSPNLCYLSSVGVEDWCQSGHGVWCHSFPATLPDRECPWGEEASPAGKEVGLSAKGVHSMWGAWMQQAGTKPCEIANAWGKSRWWLASKEGCCNVPSTLHLLPGKVIRRPPTLCSADASAVSGIPAGFSLLRGVPGTCCEDRDSARERESFVASVSSSLFSHHHRAS